MLKDFSGSVISKCRAGLAALGLALLTTALPSNASGQDQTQVVTPHGTLSGSSQNGMDAWLGIPFAASPVGKLRWQPPAPVKPWKGNYLARTAPAKCAQNADLGLFASPGGSEDCLYLNVYRPAGTPANAKLPVLVWFHGGSIWVGQGVDYNPSKLATKGGVIVVTTNYRLGLFGYFAHPEIDREGHSIANYGLMDQQAAMRWVQRNIGVFGGNPANVTIAGESSGGNSVLLHTVSPTAANTFQHAIAMSGGAIVLRHPAFGAPRPLSAAQNVGVSYAKSIGCEKRIAECLRSLTTKQILDTQTPYLINQTIIDGQIIPGHPADLMRDGKVNRVSLINGNTRDEGRFFAGLTENQTGQAMTEASWKATLEGFYGAPLAELVKREYPLANYNSPSESYAAAVGDSLFACPGLHANRLLVGKVPLLAYEFADDTAPAYLDPVTFPLLAAHTSEISYLFPGFRGGSNAQVKLNAMQEKLSDQMIDHFIGSHISQKKLTVWPQFTAENEEVLVLKLPEPFVSSNRFSKFHHCEFWDRSGIY